jgi:SAM-dependent methyltransferase
LSDAATSKLGDSRTSCPACGSLDLRFWRVARTSDRRFSGEPKYTLLRCPNCGSAVLEREKIEVDEDLYRAGTYVSSRRSAEWLLSPLRRLVEKQRLGYFRGLKPGASIFEVGAGDGSFLAALESRGFHTSGLDPSAPAEPARPIERIPLEEAQLANSSLDAILFWHVLEHLSDPAAALERVMPALVPGGRLVVAVPNLDSLQARIGGDVWFHQDVPRHIMQFTSRGLKELVERSGFTLESISGFVWDQNLLGMWQSLLNRVTREPDVAFRFLKRQLPHESRASAVLDLFLTAVAGSLLVAPAVAAEVIADLSGHGGTIVAVATKAVEQS